MYGGGEQSRLRVFNDWTTFSFYCSFELIFFAALRRTVSGAVSDEDFANFQLFFEAGLPDFVFMRRCKTVQDIKVKRESEKVLHLLQMLLPLFHLECKFLLTFLFSFSLPFLLLPLLSPSFSLVLVFGLLLKLPLRIKIV